MLQLNDYKLLDSITVINTKEKSNTVKEVPKFCFEHDELNHKLVKILFFSSFEKLDKSKIDDSNTKMLKKFFVSKTAIFDNLINENDYYSQSILSCLQSDLKLFNLSDFLYFVNNNDMKKFINYIPLNLIEKIQTSMQNIELLKIQYYAEKINENQFFNTLKDHLDSIYEVINKEIYGNDNTVETNFYKQIALYKLGLYHTLISILRTFKNDNYLEEFLTNSNLTEIFNKSLLRLFEIISNQNPFLVALNFNKNIVTLFFESPETKLKDSNKSHISNQFLDFYITQIKVLKKFNYKIEFKVLLDKTIPTIFKVLTLLSKHDSKGSKINKILKIFSYALSLNNIKTHDVLTDHISSALKSLFRSKFFHKFLLDIRKDNLSKGIFYIKIDETEKLLENNHEVVGRLCKIMNNLHTQYFFFLTQIVKSDKKEDKSTIFGQKISSPFSQQIKSYSIIEIIELYIKKVRNQSPKYLSLYLLTFYKKNFENCKVITKNKYEELPIFENNNEEIGLVIQGVEDEIEIETENNLFEDQEKSAKKKDEIILKIKKRLLEKEQSLKIVKKYLKNYPKIIKKHFSLFTTDIELLFEYFKNVIIFPILQIVHQHILNKKTINTTVICEISSLNLMFLENYKIFLTIVKNLYQGENRLNILHLVESFYKTTDKIEQFLDSKLSFLNKKIKEVQSHDFPHLNLGLILEIFSNSLENIIFFDKIVKGINNDDEKPLVKSVNSFYSSLDTIIKEYYSLKKEFDSENMLLYNIFRKDDSLSSRIKNSICLSLIVKFEESEIYSVTPYTEKNLIIIESLDKVFKADPKHVQEFLTNFNYSLDIIQNIIQKQLLYLIQPINVEFQSLSCDKNHNPYKYFLLLIEFLRLTCENHNACFQTLLFNFKVLPKKKLNDLDLNSKNRMKSEFYYILRKNERSTFLNFIFNFFVICVNTKMLSFVKNKQNLIRYFKTGNCDYYYQIIEKFTDLIIEMIQGTFPFNLAKLSVNSKFLSKYLKSMILNFSMITLGEEVEFLLLNFMKFLKAYMEEKENPMVNKREIIKIINPKQMFNCFIYVVKKLYVKYFESSDKIKLPSYKLPKGAGKMLENLYLTDKKFIEDPLFILSSQIYHFFMVSVSLDCSYNQNYLKIINDLKDQYFKKDENKSQEVISNGEIYSFYSQIVNTLEISYVTNKVDVNEIKKYEKLFYSLENRKTIIKEMNLLSEKESESSLKKVVFIAHPSTLFLTQMDMRKFFENAPYETFNDKLSYILENIPSFLDLINLRQNLYKYSKTLFYLYSIDYDKVSDYSVFISLIINVLLFFSLFLSDSDSIESSYYIIDWSVFVISFFHIVSNFSCIINYLGFNIYRLNTFTFKRSDELNSYEKMCAHMSLLVEKDLFPIVWNFIFGFLGILSENTRWMYSLQLFSAFMIFPTMTLVITSIKVRYNQFFSTAMLMIIVLLFYSSISFYFFRDLYFDPDLNVIILYKL